MKRKVRQIICLLMVANLFLYKAKLTAQESNFKSLVEFVNPLMGTDSEYVLSNGNTYPAIAVPWGMNFWTPQTGKMGVGQLGYNNISKLNKMIKEKTQWIRNDNSLIREIDDAVKNTCYMS